MNDQIRSLESRCIEEGVVVLNLPEAATCYMYVNGPFVGACSGDFTHFVWVEMYGGTYHGYPISEDLLRDRLRKKGLPGP